MSFERIGSETVWQGRIGTVRVERYRHDDGEEVVREVVGHPGAVVVAAYDSEHVLLVRQPREIVGEEALLELPAGKLDVAGEAPLEAARRELAEECGKAAADWRQVADMYSSPGFTDERFVLFLATGLRDVPAGGDEEERIEVVAWPLEDLDAAVDGCRDAKTVAGLLWLRRELRG